MEEIANIIGGEKLNARPIHKSIKKNRAMFGSDIDDRYREFSSRFIDETLPEADKLPKHVFYPTADFHDIISEIATQIPTDFNSTGTNAEFVRKNLIEGSFLKEALVKVYLEMLFGINAYVLMIPQVDVDGDYGVTFKLEVLKGEEVWVFRDIVTGEPNKIITQKEKSVYDDNNIEVRYLETIEYTNETVKTYYRNVSNGGRVNNFTDKNVENPFKEYGVLPVIEFKGYSENGEPLANKLIESQLQMDNLNTNIENMLNMHSNPIYVIEGTLKDFRNIQLGAGTVLALGRDEKFKSVTADMQLADIQAKFVNKRDDMYKSGGLTPPTLRLRMFGTDSSKVTRMANAEIIAMAKIVILFTKKAINKIVRMSCLFNGKGYTDEKLVPPSEILPFDLESVLNTLAVGLNLGVLDAEWFWNKYMPELGQDEKDRIKEFFDNREDLSMDNTNTNNIAKVGKPAGNKEQSQMTKEEKDGRITK